jgi:glycerol-3-phosphate dehydrogenase
MARTLDDVLARRTRALYLNAGAALAMARSRCVCWRVNWAGTNLGKFDNSKTSPRGRLF